MQKTKERYTLSKMRPIVAGYANFKGTKKAYCLSYDLNPHTLDYWRKRIKEQDATEKKAKLSGQVGFKVVAPPAALTSSLVSNTLFYTLHLPDGKSLELPRTTPIEILTQLLQTQV